MNRPLGIGDFLIELKEASFKGDTPGHPFRGNQYDGGAGVGESNNHLVASGELEKLNSREKKALSEIPQSSNHQPIAEEIMNNGKIAHFVRVGNPSYGSSDNGLVMRGGDGKHYAAKGSNVFEVARVKPYLGKWMNPKNSYSMAET